jgi:Leucine-rich repeat (LRR) protein
LKENLRGASCEEIMELELKECNLKDFEDMFTIKKFPKLAELDLTGNHFSSVKMIGNLPTLKILILQANKIETLYYNNDIAIVKGLNGCQVYIQLRRTYKFSI